MYPVGVAEKATAAGMAARREQLKIAREIQKKTDALIKKYLGNTRLKAAGAKVSLSQKQVVEYTKCADNPIYFIERYVKIVNLDEGLIQIKLYDKQKEMIKCVHDNQKSIIKAARQVGKTTTLGVGYILWYILFNPDKTVGILANKEITAAEILSRIKIAYGNLPLWMQQGVSEWNKTSIELDNGSGVLCASTSSSAIRGWSINFLYLDEYAFVPPNIANEFFASVYPTISSGKTTKIVITSTPNGLNQFYAIYRGAEIEEGNKGWNGFHYREYDWTVVPWRDQKWADEQKATLGEEKFEQEYLCMFHGSSGTLISGKVLRSMAWITPIDKKLNGMGRDDHKLLIYRTPVPGNVYCLTADTSHGKELDFSAFSIIDMTQSPYYVVASFRDNNISPLLYPSVIVSAAKHYNNAWVLAENNDIGAQVIHIVAQELEYEQIIYTTDYKSITKASEISGKTPGVRTTPKVKRQGCMALKTLIESQQLICEDFNTIEEFGTFVVRSNKTYGADDDKHDDLVITLMLFAWLTNQEYFKELTNSDMRKILYADREREISEDLAPAPVLPFSSQREIPGLPKHFIRDKDCVWEIVTNDGDNPYGLDPEDAFVDPYPDMWSSGTN